MTHRHSPPPYLARGPVRASPFPIPIHPARGGHYVRTAPLPFAALRRWFVENGVLPVLQEALRKSTATEAMVLDEGGTSVRELLQRAARPEPLRAAPRVAVVGAGLAGVACARRLRDAGVPVVVLEASDRLGGRLQSLDDVNLGAAWMHSAPDNPLVPLLARRGFRMRRDEGRRWVAGPQGDPLQHGQALSDAVQGLSSRLLGADDGACHLHAQGADPWAVAVLGPLSMGVEMDRMSRQDFTTLAAEDDDVLVLDGLDGLVEALATGLDVRLREPVLEVKWGTRAVVRTPRSVWPVDAVVVTVSNGVLASNTIAFRPSLPSLVQDALRTLPMGRLEKHVFFFDRRLPWPGDDVLHLHVRSPGAERVEYVVGPDRRVVAAVVGGSGVGEDEAARVEHWLGRLTDRRPVRRVSTRWSSHPWTRGAYSAALPGGHGARSVLGGAWGALVLAGEASETRWAASAPGAYASGVRAAEQVLSRFERGQSAGQASE
jgi:monoamine oxidase